MNLYTGVNLYLFLEGAKQNFTWLTHISRPWYFLLGAITPLAAPLDRRHFMYMYTAVYTRRQLNTQAGRDRFHATTKRHIQSRLKLITDKTPNMHLLHSTCRALQTSKRHHRRQLQQNDQLRSHRTWNASLHYPVSCDYQYWSSGVTGNSWKCSYRTNIAISTSRTQTVNVQWPSIRSRSRWLRMTTY